MARVEQRTLQMEEVISRIDIPQKENHNTIHNIEQSGKGIIYKRLQQKQTMELHEKFLDFKE